MKHILEKLQKFWDELPSSPQDILFEIIVMVAKLIHTAPILRHISRFMTQTIRVTLCSISPALPIEMKNMFDAEQKELVFYRKIFLCTASLTFLLSFCFKVFISYRSGTLDRSSIPGIIGFWDDWHNIILFTTIVPAYVATCICLIITITMSWKEVNHTAISGTTVKEDYEKSIDAKYGLRLVAFATISLLIASLFISHYIDQLRDPEITKVQYWFFSNPDPSSNIRILNKAGSYYLFLNTILLLVTAFAALCYISISIEAFRLGRELPAILFSQGKKDWENGTIRKLTTKRNKFRKLVSAFTKSYLWTKTVILIYMINILIWQDSPASSVQNVDVAIIILIAFGLFFVALPRLYLGSRWYALEIQYCRRNDINLNKTESGYIWIENRNLKRVSIALTIAYGLVAVEVLSNWEINQYIINILSF